VVVGAGIAGWLVATALFMLWKHGATGYQSPNFVLHGDVVSSALRRSLQLLPLTGIALAPVLVLAGPVRLVRASVRRAPRLSLVTALAVGGVVGVLTAARGRPLGTGNYVEPYGVLGRYVLPGSRAQLLDDVTLAALGAVGVVSITVVAVGFVRPVVDQWVAARDRRYGPPSDPGPALVALALFGFLLFIVASGVAGNALWDRYLLPVLPLLGLLLLRASPAPPVAPAPNRARRIGAVVALGALGAFGLVFSVNSASFDGARWTVAAAAARDVGAPERVNGGFEWVDYHAGREVYLRDPVSDRFCVQLEGRAQRPRASERSVVASAGVWGPGGNQTWIVAHRTRACAG
jgi:hypothetical protein